MPDGSASWPQPPSRNRFGVKGWEGYCGQTAVANLLTNSKLLCVSPTAVSETSGDFGPGSHPHTLIRSLQKLAPGKFEITIGEGLGGASPSRPIATLLWWTVSSFHWVTVVRAKGGRITFNHWGKQESLTTTEFRRRWNFGLAAGLAQQIGGIQSWTSIRRT